VTYSIIAVIILGILLFGIVYSIYCKTYEYLFVSIYTLLPDYFSFEINEHLPLFSVSRIMLLILLCYTLLRPQTRKALCNYRTFFVPFSLPSKLVIGYVVMRIISNLYYVTTYNSSVKSILSVLFEEGMMLLLLGVQFSTYEKIERAIRSIITVSGFVFALAIYESISRFNVGSLFYLAQRHLLDEYYIRLGLLRADLTFGLPSFFATYCVVMVPLILYLYEKNYEKRYLLILTLDVFAVIHTGSRAQLLFLGFMVILMFLFQKKESKLHYVKVYGQLIAISLCIVILLSAVSSHLRYFYIGTGKSLLNEVGFHFDLDEDAPTGVAGFGDNQKGTSSRLWQLSGITYTLNKNPLFGLGAKAQNRGDVHYLYKPGKWVPAYTYDVAYVGIICDGGLTGLAAFCMLYLAAFLFLFKNTNKLSKALLFALLSYLLCLLSIGTMDHFNWLLFSLIYANQWIAADTKNLPNHTTARS